MPIDFPNSPSNGSTHTVNGVTWEYDGTAWNVASGGAGLRVSATAPTSPATGDLWYDSESGKVFIYYDSQWVSPAVVASVPTASAGTITGSNGEGTASTFARSDHNHALGADVVTATELRDDASTDANRAVTTNHIRDGAVTSAKIASGAVTSAKLGLTSLNDTPSSNTTFNASSGSTDVTGLSITCAAGTWLIIAHLDVTHFGGTPRIDVWNYTDSLTIGNINFLTGFSNPSRLPITLMRFTTFTDTKTVTIRMASGSGTSNFTIESAHTTLTAIRLG